MNANGLSQKTYYLRARVFNIEITSKTLRQGNEGDSLYGE